MDEKKNWSDYRQKAVEPRCERTKNHMEGVRKYLNSKKLTLCIGAGITAPLLGNWNSLLNELAIMRCCDTAAADNENIDLEFMHSFIEGHVDEKAFIPSSTNVLEQGEYLMYDCEDQTAGYMSDSTFDKGMGIRAQFWREKYFAAQTQRCIDSLQKKRIGDQSIVDYYLRWRKKPDEKVPIGTLDAVIELCILKDVEEIIVYNFDAIMETLLIDKRVWAAFGHESERKNVEVYSYYKKEPIKGLGINDAPPKNGTIRIYHVHGVINRVNEEVQPIIFSENSYLAYQDRMLNWSNVRIADAMYHSALLCVGFSGNDPNFRLLCRLFSDINKHPIFLQEDSEPYPVYLMRIFSKDIERFIKKVKDDKDDSEKLVLPNTDEEILCTYYCAKTYLEAVENYFDHQMNISVLWFDTFDGIVDALNDLGK